MCKEEFYNLHSSPILGTQSKEGVGWAYRTLVGESRRWLKDNGFETIDMRWRGIVVSIKIGMFHLVW